MFPDLEPHAGQAVWGIRHCKRKRNALYREINKQQQRIVKKNNKTTTIANNPPTVIDVLTRSQFLEL